MESWLIKLKSLVILTEMTVSKLHKWIKWPTTVVRAQTFNYQFWRIIVPKGHFRRAAGIASMVSGCPSTPIHYAAGRAGWRTVALPMVLPFRRASRKVSNRLILWITFGGSISKWVAQALYQSHILQIWDVGRLGKQSEFGRWILWGPHALHGWI